MFAPISRPVMDERVEDAELRVERAESAGVGNAETCLPKPRSALSTELARVSAKITPRHGVMPTTGLWCPLAFPPGNRIGSVVRFPVCNAKSHRLITKERWLIRRKGKRTSEREKAEVASRRVLERINTARATFSLPTSSFKLVKLHERSKCAK